MEGRGAWLRAGDAADVRLSCASFRESDAGLVLVGSASHNTPDTQAFVADYAAPQFTQLGSSLKLLLVAEGAAHVYPRLAPTCEWDTAAAHAVVTEAGGEVLAPAGIPTAPRPARAATVATAEMVAQRTRLLRLL